jgi:hypothetical protein
VLVAALVAAWRAGSAWSLALVAGLVPHQATLGR